MFKTMIKETLSLGICVIFSQTLLSEPIIEKAANIIYLNGIETRVYFNDADTFKVLEGKNNHARARIKGINAPETFGDVHIWLNNTAEYLLEQANLATKMAQNGKWHCTIESGKDGYGRLLAQCDDLSQALISAGLAHAYSIDKEPAPENYLKIQALAQAKKLGIWQGGVPQYIITSLHSAHEGHKTTFNRLISTKDGTSELWHHNDTYDICEIVCMKDEESCMVYVPFERRYGSNKADCLRLDNKKGRFKNGTAYK